MVKITLNRVKNLITFNMILKHLLNKGKKLRKVNLQHLKNQPQKEINKAKKVKND